MPKQKQKATKATASSSTSAIKLDDPSLASVSDPTDFPPETDAPGLRKLDNAFACSICGEVFNAPVGLPCGHAFCSLCVRQYLREQHECPQCRTPAEEGKLVKSVQLEELADCWRVARATILEVFVDKKKLEEERLERAERPRKQRKVVDSDWDRHSNPGARTGVAAPPSSSTGSAQMSDVVEIDDEMSEDEVAEVPKPKSEPEMAKCPVCDQPILFKHINVHLDSGCQRFLASNVGKEASKRVDAKSAWNSVFGVGSASSSSKAKDREVITGNDRIPISSYVVLKEKKIREMLNDHGLPASGPRDHLIARHAQFVTIYNANLDSSEKNRKNLAELRKDLSEWERMKTVKKPSVGSAREYLEKNEADFRRHVDLARASSKRITATKDSSSSSKPNKSSSPVESSPRKSSPRKKSGSEGHRATVVVAAAGQQEL